MFLVFRFLEGGHHLAIIVVAILVNNANPIAKELFVVLHPGPGLVVVSAPGVAVLKHVDHVNYDRQDEDDNDFSCERHPGTL